MRKYMFVLVLAVAAGCNDDGGGTAYPAEVQSAVDYLVGESRGAISFLQHIPQALVLALLDPAGAADEGIIFAEGATPDTFDFVIPIDTDGDGEPDSTAAGRVSLSQTPVVGPNPGLTGTINANVTLEDGSTVAGQVFFASTAEGLEISGAVTFTDTQSGYTGEITIPGTDPLILKEAAGGARANLCTLSGQGNAFLEATREPAVAGGSPLYFAATLELLFASATARLTHVSAGDSETTAEELSDSNLDLGCDFSMADWVGTFETYWFCPPGGGGFETHTFEVTGSNTVRVTKQSTGAPTPTIFTGTAIPGNPHVIIGEFTEGDPLYTETFRYTLSPDGSYFTQDNDYEVIEGPSTGDGGPCFGTGWKQ